jgi:hypothetical protein
VAIVFSGTRAAIAGALLGWLYIGLVLRSRIRFRAVAVALMLVLAGGAAFYISPAGQQLRSRTRWFVEDPLGGPRLMMWRDSLVMSAEHPLVGAGLESFSSEFPKFQSIELARRFPDFHHESPHNLFIEALTQQGIPGVLLLVGVTSLGGIGAWRMRRTAPEMAATLGACWLALLTAHQFTSFTAPTALFFLVVIALLTGLPPRSQNGVTTHGAFKFITRCIAGIVAAVLLTFAVRLGVADRELYLTRTAIERGNLPEAKGLYGRVLAHQPPGMSADLWYSRAMAKAAQDCPTLLVRFEGWADAMQAAVRATRTSEEPHNAWYSLAMLAAAQNDSALTERALRSAIAAAPHWYKPRWILAKFLHLTGRPEEAQVQITSALDYAGGKHAELHETAQILKNSARSR